MPTVIRTGPDAALDDLEGMYHRVGTGCPPYADRSVRHDVGVIAANGRNDGSTHPYAGR
jgi:hypothetical protein